MKFSVKKTRENIINFGRRIGYIATHRTPKNEVSLVRTLGGEYPRFHLYVKEEGSDKLLLNLHLDQKRPTYKGSHAHSGEYDGELVEKEVKRIQQILEN